MFDKIAFRIMWAFYKLIILWKNINLYFNRPVTYGKQTLFNIAWYTISKQGRPSVGKNGMCSYRGPNDTKCVIGQIIPDSKYTPTWDRAGENYVGDVLREVGIKVPLDYASDLQRAHDSFSRHPNFLEKFQEEMRRVADRHNLKVPAYETV
jgi:hypothetical protein